MFLVLMTVIDSTKLYIATDQEEGKKHQSPSYNKTVKMYRVHRITR
jgi:hypothetical protein